MKAILTLLFVILFGAVAIAQNNESTQKVKGITAEVVLFPQEKDPIINEDLNHNPAKEIALVFKYRNTRIKDSLAFTASKRRSRLA